MKDLKPAILLLFLFTIICGGIYPALVTGIAQTLFPQQANGSIIVDKSGQPAGSRLIGQSFTAPGYFWPRPSASGEFAYNPLASGGSNAGPTSPDYLKTVAQRVAMLRKSGIAAPLPAELVQASASGLDPHISPAAAQLQISRVARARGVSEAELARLVSAATEGRQFGFLGEPRINTVVLNLELDRLRP